MRRILLVASFLACKALAQGQPTECITTFEQGRNQPGWNWGTWHSAVEENGGNPGAFLRDASLVTDLPQLVTINAGSCYSGDLKAKGTSLFQFNLKAYTFGEESSEPLRAVTLVLWHDNGTPSDYGDDWGAYHVGSQSLHIPASEEQSWGEYGFFIPYKEQSLPAGWTFFRRKDTELDWNKLISNVSAMSLLLGDPRVRYDVRSWDIALDNVLLQ